MDNVALGKQLMFPCCTSRIKRYECCSFVFIRVGSSFAIVLGQP